MRTLIIFLFVFIPLINYAHSGDTIRVSQGTIPIIDGTISSGEWDDAEIFTYQAGFTGQEITVTFYIKHNGIDTLYIAQNMPNTLSGDRDLIMFDTYNNGGTNPQTDDYMLNKYHMNGSPTIEEQGTGSLWNMVPQNGWNVALTGEDWSNNIGQIEFAVAFSKLGITTGIQKTIGFGIAFGELTIPYYDPSRIWQWPLNNDLLNPNSWADLIFFDTLNSINKQINEQKDNSILIFPNPNNGRFTIKGDVDQSIEIINKIGQVVLSHRFPGSNNQNIIDMRNQPNGIYFVKIVSNRNTIIKKIILDLK